MAKKRRGPGRPPKRRGPGRPPGSKNKPKPESGRQIYDAARQAVRRDELPTRAEVDKLTVLVQQYFNQAAAEWNVSLERQKGLSDRLDKLEIGLKNLIADAEHPTTVILARRLLAIEQGEKITRTIHERLNTLEQRVRDVRTELADLVNERAMARNRNEVERLAEESDGHGNE